MNDGINLTEELRKQSIFRIEDNLRRLKGAFELLNEEEVWVKPSAASNSPGILILHMCGNLSYFIGTNLGNTGYVRNRPKEFVAQPSMGKDALLHRIDQAVSQAVQVITMLREPDLLQRKIIHGFEFTGVGILVNAVQHFAYHTGQILFWVKLKRDRDLQLSLW